MHIGSLDLYVPDNRVNPRAASYFNPFRRTVLYIHTYKCIKI